MQWKDRSWPNSDLSNAMLAKTVSLLGDYCGPALCHFPWAFHFPEKTSHTINRSSRMRERVLQLLNIAGRRMVTRFEQLTLPFKHRNLLMEEGQSLDFPFRVTVPSVIYQAVFMDAEKAPATAEDPTLRM